MARFAVLGLSAVLAGCAVGPDYARPLIAVPGVWNGANAETPGQPVSLAPWWKSLRDPTLNALIDEAVAGNLDVARAKARVREARATYQQAVAPLFPSADGSGSATRSKSAGRDGGSGTGGSSGAISNTFRAGLDASWEVDLFGANRRGVEAARYGLDAAGEDLRATLVTLLGDVATNYVEARGYQARIALARRTAASQRSTEALTRRKFDAGTASGMDTANASGQASSTEAAIPALESSYAQSVHRLSVLTGQPPATLMGRMRRTAPIPTPRLPLPVGIPADILTSRPDVRLAERQLAQATARIGEAEAQRYPKISLTGNITTSAAQLGDLARNSSMSWAFGPTLSIPVFNAGQLQAAVEAAQARRDEQFLAYRASVLTALEDVENALVSLSKNRERSRKLASAAASYGEATRLSRALYENGASSFLDVLNAERSLYSSEDALLQSRIAITLDYIALNKALGGGWTGTADSSQPVIIDKMGPRLARLTPVDAAP